MHRSDWFAMQPIIQVSSAYLIIVTLLRLDVIRFVYMENKRGDMQQPWGVPVFVIMGFESLLSTIVFCTLLERKL